MNVEKVKFFCVCGDIVLFGILTGMSFDHKKIEEKWNKTWREQGTYKVDLDKAKKPFYNLMMFPYPSAEGLHVGNMYAFTGADFYGRFKAMQGYDVFEPIGLDGFGIHSENYAIKIGKHPAEQAKISQKHFYEQLLKIGNRFSWDNRLETYDPEYYKWTQWLFVKMFEKGLAYRKKSLVNWCPSCMTVLSDEQVEAGQCERCKTETTKKETFQWFFKITEYAQRLLDNIDKIDWPEKIKIAQKNWIGRKTGVDISYQIKGLHTGSEPVCVKCFTTRPDTNFGATFVVVGPEHELVKKMIAGEIKVKDKKAVEEYVKKALKKSEIDRIAEGKKKTGVDTGLVAINDLTGREMPIFVTDFVLGHVGTGAVVGVPGHDERDFEFAKEFNLEVIRVVVASDGDKSEITKVEQVQEDEGTMINSEFLDGMDIHKATEKIMDYFEEKGWGKRVVSYRLRDWCISRQRYWGPPIPMIECEKCGFVPEKLENLPVRLPEVQDYKPTGDGKSPLEKADESWLYTDCPKCGGKAKRETDVSDTFLDSSWYFLRYPSILHSRSERSSHSGSVMEKWPFDDEIVKKWLPVDAYIGGAEHAVLHLMYARFVTMALKDWGMIDFEEPFPFLFGHGLIIKDGTKMSKSKGNIVNPDEYLSRYGADALRMYLMFIGPYKQGGDFRDTGMVGISKFLNRLWLLFEGKMGVKTSEKLLKKLEQTIKKVGEDMERFSYNTAIACIMECINVWREKGEVLSSEDGMRLVKLLAPMAPYMSEEVWAKLGGEGSIHQQLWPKYDAKLIESDQVTVVVQVNGKLRGQLEISKEESGDKEKVLKLAREVEAVKKFVGDKKIVKEIFVPGKLVNLVVG